MHMASKSRTTTSRRDIPPVHPGEVLAEEFILPNGLTSYRVSQDIGVTQPRVNDVMLAKRRISADLALRLANYFGVSPEFWMNLQAKYDLDVARDEIGDELAGIRKFDRATIERVVRPRTMMRERAVRTAAKVSAKKR